MLSVDYRCDPSSFADAEAVYLEVRRAEGRVLSPEALRELPLVAAGDPHVREWRIRAATTDRLIGFLRGHRPHPHILDLGCGPGWMTAILARELEATAIGIDCNRSELERGAEAFGTVEGLELVYGDIFEPVVDPASFDIIIVAAALQYFPDPHALLIRLLDLLKPGGEILVADTPLYRREEIPAAAERTRAYYTELGFPRMAEHYHHHALDDLAAFSPGIIYDPRSMLSRIGRTVFRRPLSPFPILRISRPEKP
ncbi:MAG: class I SAM-dependent methyltransferase [Acidobacteria bacterium]|nr:class I SAM-dependent methyltransferase [Acidobacteriota bacterium]